MYLCIHTQQQKFMKQFSPSVRCSVISYFPSFRNLDGNQWNDFIVWFVSFKRSLESRGSHSWHYWHFKPNSSWLWVCWPVYWRMLSSLPGFYPPDARGNPFSTVMIQPLDILRSTLGAGGWDTKMTPVWEPLIWMTQRSVPHMNKGALRLCVSYVPLPPPSHTFEKCV